MTNETKKIQPGRWALCQSYVLHCEAGKSPWMIDKVSKSRVYLSRTRVDPIDGQEERQEKYVSAESIHSTYDTKEDASEVGEFDWTILDQIKSLRASHRNSLNELIAKKGGIK